MAHDKALFEIVHVEMIHVFPTFQGRVVYQISRENLTRLMTSSYQNLVDLGAGHRCLICTEVPSRKRPFTKDEHFIPEGLGFRWAALNDGIATCDACNSRFSGYEAEWLRQGSMGRYRPWYVDKGKDGKPPAYYAPRKTDYKFSVAQRDGVFEVSFDRTAFEGKWEAIDGPGILTFQIMATRDRPPLVSAALHKTALLTFWLTWGPFAYDSTFNSLREFLIEPSEQNYRPYYETQLENTPAGARLGFVVRWEPAVAGKCVLNMADPQGNVGQYALRALETYIRIHNMAYLLTLVGPPLPEPSEQFVKREWCDPREIPQPEPTVVSFGFEDLKPVDKK